LIFFLRQSGTKLSKIIIDFWLYRTVFYR